MAAPPSTPQRVALSAPATPRFVVRAEREVEDRHVEPARARAAHDVVAGHAHPTDSTSIPFLVVVLAQCTAPERSWWVKTACPAAAAFALQNPAQLEPAVTSCAATVFGATATATLVGIGEEVSLLRAFRVVCVRAVQHSSLYISFCQW